MLLIQISGENLLSLIPDVKTISGVIIGAIIGALATFYGVKWQMNQMRLQDFQDEKHLLLSHIGRIEIEITRNFVIIQDLQDALNEIAHSKKAHFNYISKIADAFSFIEYYALINADLHYNIERLKFSTIFSTYNDVRNLYEKIKIYEARVSYTDLNDDKANSLLIEIKTDVRNLSEKYEETEKTINKSIDEINKEFAENFKHLRYVLLPGYTYRRQISKQYRPNDKF
jgi:chromosome segregation ATPase